MDGWARGECLSLFDLLMLPLLRVARCDAVQ